ncbi:7472_t:CDS:1, partial [Racocetra persica]
VYQNKSYNRDVNQTKTETSSILPYVSPETLSDQKFKPVVGKDLRFLEPCLRRSRGFIGQRFTPA